MQKEEILQKLIEVEARLKAGLPSEEEYVNVARYRYLVRKDEAGRQIWTEAIQTALWEQRAVYLPERREPYYVDGTIEIPSGRHIKADPQAVIRQPEGVRVLMFRNVNTVDGTHLPPAREGRDCDISIIGGRWEESHTMRAGYGRSGMYDEERSFYGVSACMLFNHIERLVLRDMIFVHTGGFAVQAGELSDVLFENITFVECFADGLHINGNSENLVIRDIRGQVGDDLVALNMYDWQNSSVNFGPMKNVLCDNLQLSPDSGYKAMRIEPGIYYFDDGSQVDCSLENAIIRKVTGINTFKLYFQTPRYRIGEEPEKGAVGSGDHIYFEDITIDLDGPIDRLEEYLTSDPVRGTFAGFELGANIGHLFLEDIRIRLHRDQYPMSFLVCIGPKSCIRDGIEEVFDPYLSSMVEKLYLKNIEVNGEQITDAAPYLKEIRFEDVNGDGHSTGCGVIKEVIIS